MFSAGFISGSRDVLMVCFYFRARLFKARFKLVLGYWNFDSSLMANQ